MGAKVIHLNKNRQTTTVKGAKKAFTVNWNLLSTKYRKGISGYQLQYSTSSKMSTNRKTLFVKGANITSKKITGLTGGKNYYVRVRTYKLVDGKRYYSSWSPVKKVKTAK